VRRFVAVIVNCALYMTGDIDSCGTVTLNELVVTFSSATEDWELRGVPASIDVLLFLLAVKVPTRYRAISQSSQKCTAM